jgi:hypothetical protein
MALSKRSRKSEGLVPESQPKKTRPDKSASTTSAPPTSPESAASEASESEPRRSARPPQHVSVSQVSTSDDNKPASRSSEDPKESRRRASGEQLEHAQPHVPNGNAPADTEPAAGRRMTAPPQKVEKKKKKKKKQKEYWTPLRIRSGTKFTKITQAAIDNARNADPNQGRCLLENVERGNQAVHVIRRATGTDLVHTFLLCLSMRSSDKCS